ncbi:MAG: hypothetical protein LBU65_03255 [Planctomycetaceae bacterium]|nr:hypothetical protein [Planctomycetaceae bacterium]
MNTITSRSATEFLLHEKFQALLSELNTVGDNASSGHVLDTVFDSCGRLSLHRDSKIR